MINKGKRTYIPQITIKQIENIKLNYNMNKQSDAFKKMVSLSQLGMEVEKMSGYYYLENKLKNKK